MSVFDSSPSSVSFSLFLLSDIYIEEKKRNLTHFWERSMLWVLSCADQIFLLVFVSYLSSETQVSHLLENVKISIFAKFEDKISKSAAHLFVLSWCFENSVLFWDERPLTHSWSISLSQFHCHPWVENKKRLETGDSEIT